MPAAWIACVMTASLLCMLFGCQPAQPILSDTTTLLIEPTGPLPTYGELIERYNKTTEPLGRVWAVARADFVWLDDKGKRKSEHGDGRFMFVSPGKVALEIQEFGKGFWAGGDGRRYWLFDLQDPRTAYVGRFENLDPALGPDAESLTLPINPADLLYVLGLAPIDSQAVPDEPAVEYLDGHYLIEPPGLGLRMLLDPATARPVRVDLIDAQGRSTVICRLSGDTKVKTYTSEGKPQPTIPAKVELVVVGQDATMILKLSDASVGVSRIRDNHFDFDTLSTALKIDQVVDLDAPVP